MRFTIRKSMTAVLASLAMAGTLAMASSPAEAGWRRGGWHGPAYHRAGFYPRVHYVGYRGYRHYGHRHYGHRHYGHRHYGHRHYGYRHYGYRHYGWRRPYYGYGRAYYPRYRHYGYRRYNPGAAIAASVIGGLALGALSSGYYYHRPHYSPYYW